MQLSKIFIWFPNIKFFYPDQLFSVSFLHREIEPRNHVDVYVCALCLVPGDLIQLFWLPLCFAHFISAKLPNSKLYGRAAARTPLSHKSFPFVPDFLLTIFLLSAHYSSRRMDVAIKLASNIKDALYVATGAVAPASSVAFNVATSTISLMAHGHEPSIEHAVHISHSGESPHPHQLSESLSLSPPPLPSSPESLSPSPGTRPTLSALLWGGGGLHHRISARRLLRPSSSSSPSTDHCDDAESSASSICSSHQSSPHHFHPSPSKRTASDRQPHRSRGNYDNGSARQSHLQLDQPQYNVTNVTKEKALVRGVITGLNGSIGRSSSGNSSSITFPPCVAMEPISTEHSGTPTTLRPHLLNLCQLPIKAKTDELAVNKTDNQCTRIQPRQLEPPSSFSTAHLSSSSVRCASSEVTSGLSKKASTSLPRPVIPPRVVISEIDRRFSYALSSSHISASTRVKAASMTAMVDDQSENTSINKSHRDATFIPTAVTSAAVHDGDRRRSVQTETQPHLLKSVESSSNIEVQCQPHRAGNNKKSEKMDPSLAVPLEDLIFGFNGVQYKLRNGAAVEVCSSATNAATRRRAKQKDHVQPPPQRQQQRRSSTAALSIREVRDHGCERDDGHAWYRGEVLSWKTTRHAKTQVYVLWSEHGGADWIPSDRIRVCPLSPSHRRTESAGQVTNHDQGIPEENEYACTAVTERTGSIKQKDAIGTPIANRFNGGARIGAAQTPPGLGDESPAETPKMSFEQRKALNLMGKSPPLSPFLAPNDELRKKQQCPYCHSYYSRGGPFSSHVRFCSSGPINAAKQRDRKRKHGDGQQRRKTMKDEILHRPSEHAQNQSQQNQKDQPFVNGQIAQTQKRCRSSSTIHVGGSQMHSSESLSPQKKSSATIAKMPVTSRSLASLFDLCASDDDDDNARRGFGRGSVVVVSADPCIAPNPKKVVDREQTTAAPQRDTRQRSLSVNTSTSSTTGVAVPQHDCVVTKAPLKEDVEPATAHIFTAEERIRAAEDTRLRRAIALHQQQAVLLLQQQEQQQGRVSTPDSKRSGSLSEREGSNCISNTVINNGQGDNFHRSAEHDNMIGASGIVAESYAAPEDEHNTLQYDNDIDDNHHLPSLAAGSTSFHSAVFLPLSQSAMSLYPYF